jgi:acetoin utilization deacetylase AcuC-like enzyme
MLKIAWNPCYVLPLPPKHRFPMEKYQLLPEQLRYEGLATEANFFSPQPLPEADIVRVHLPNYWERLRNQTLSPADVRRSGFPLSEALIQREITIAQGTLDCAHFALQYGIAMNIAGGTHHAFTNRPEGFCLLNDMAIAAQALLEQGRIRQALIIDLDVHQGNGTAEIFAHRPEVFTFSMHGQHNYPLRKEHSDWDIGLPDHTDDAHYLGLLREALPRLMDEVQPDMVFFQAGVDVLATDKLGRLGLTMQGCAERDRLVLQTCHQHRVPVVVSMGGGYSPRVATIVDAHTQTFRLAQELFF